MLGLTEEQKSMFYTSGYSNNYILTFPDIDLIVDNNTLRSETVTIQESICEEEDFTLGGCIASAIGFEVFEIIADQITGLEFTAEIEVRDEEGKSVLRIPMGTFRVDSAQRVDDKDYKCVTAYDRMYDASVDVSNWYKGYFLAASKHIVKDIREDLLKYLGIPFVEQTLPNDDVILQKTTTSGTLTGTDILRALCVINGGFGRMNRQGQFEVMFCQKDTVTYLGISTSEEDVPEYHTVNYEDYVIQKITSICIQTESDLVQIGSDESNPYIISNVLLYGKTAAELEWIGLNIFNQIKDIEYRPNTTELIGLPYVEVGDAFGLNKRTDTIESFVFNRTLSGIQALIDTYEAKGNELRSNELSQSELLNQIQEQIDNNVSVTYTYRNDKEITLSADKKRIILIRYMPVDDTKAEFKATILVNVSADAQTISINDTSFQIDGKAVIEFTYYVDQNPVTTHIPVETLGSGKHIITIFYQINDIEKNAVHRFDVYATISNGTAVIETLGIMATLSGYGFSSSEIEWDGTIEFEDTFEQVPVMDAKVTIKAFNDNVSVNAVKPVSSAVFTEDFGKIQIRPNKISVRGIDGSVVFETESEE